MKKQKEIIKKKLKCAKVTFCARLFNKTCILDTYPFLG